MGGTKPLSGPMYDSMAISLHARVTCSRFACCVLHAHSLELMGYPILKTLFVHTLNLS